MAREPKKNTKPNDIAAKAQQFLDRIENLEDEKDDLKAACKDQCKDLSESQKEVYEEAKDAGIQPKALKALVKQRKLQNKIESLSSKMDMDEHAQFEALALAFGGEGFGKWAKERANQVAGGDLVDNLAS